MVRCRRRWEAGAGLRTWGNGREGMIARGVGVGLGEGFDGGLAVLLFPFLFSASPITTHYFFLCCYIPLASRTAGVFSVTIVISIIFAKVLDLPGIGVFIVLPSLLSSYSVPSFTRILSFLSSFPGSACSSCFLPFFLRTPSFLYTHSFLPFFIFLPSCVLLSSFIRIPSFLSSYSFLPSFLVDSVTCRPSPLQVAT